MANFYNKNILCLHKFIVNNKFQPPNSINLHVRCGIKSNEIPKIFNWPFTATKNQAKLVMFQYKINHNIVCTKDKLKKAKIVSEVHVPPFMCKQEKHIMERMFLKCPPVAKFWKDLYSCWHLNTNENIILSETNQMLAELSQG